MQKYAALILVLLAGRALGAEPAAGSNDFLGGDLGYPWRSELPLGASVLYRLNGLRTEAGYSRDQYVDKRTSPLSKTLDRTKVDSEGLAIAGPSSVGVKWAAEAGLSRGKDVHVYSSDDADDLTYIFSREIRRGRLSAAYPLLPNWAAGAHLSAVRVTDVNDTSALTLFGDRVETTASYTKFSPSFTWHNEDAELTATYLPKINVRNEALDVRSPATLSIWYLTKISDAATMLLGVEYEWWSALDSSQRNGGQLALGERRRTSYGELGGVMRSSRAHYREDADADSGNISRLALDLEARWRVGDGGLVGLDFTFASGADRIGGGTHSLFIGTEQVGAGVTFSETFD